MIDFVSILAKNPVGVFATQDGDVEEIETFSFQEGPKTFKGGIQ